jgi:hypothetical protein
LTLEVLVQNTATQGLPVVVTWLRTVDDPVSFGILHESIDQTVSVMGVNAVTDDSGSLFGTILVTFDTVG